MFSIVTTLSILEVIFKSESQWVEIIRNDCTCLWVKADVFPNNPELIAYSQGGKLRWDDHLVDSILKDYKVVMQHPESVYLLDLPQEDADFIQQSYGVICQSCSHLDPSILTKIDPDELFTEKNKVDYNWKSVSEGIVNPFLPSNSIIINDRYLFSGDCPEKDIEGRITGWEKHFGYDNLINFLNCFLPNKLDKCEFHVLIVTSEDAINKCKKEELVTRVNKMKKKLSPLRPYVINMELVFISESSNLYEYTHNRWVLSNYYIIRFDHKFAAFSGNRSLCTQNIRICKLYSSGLTGKSDAPVKFHDSLLLTVSEKVKDWRKCKKMSSLYAIFRNGKKNEIIGDISNRLITTAECLSDDC